jgi:hypothetical protein
MTTALDIVDAMESSGVQMQTAIRWAAERKGIKYTVLLKEYQERRRKRQRVSTMPTPTV